MAAANLHTWDVWYPGAAATGLPFARGRLEPSERLILHSPPEVIAVDVYDDARKLVARGLNLGRTQQSPMCLLRLEGKAVTREDFWPADADIGTPVLVPGGEVGILKSWWNAPDHKEWRWTAEYYNSIR